MPVTGSLRGTMRRNKYIDRSDRPLAHQTHRIHLRVLFPFHREATETSCDTSPQFDLPGRLPARYYRSLNPPTHTSNLAQSISLSCAPVHKIGSRADPEWIRRSRAAAFSRAHQQIVQLQKRPIHGTQSSAPTENSSQFERQLVPCFARWRLHPPAPQTSVHRRFQKGATY